MAKAKVNYYARPATGPLGPYGEAVLPAVPGRCSQDRKVVSTIGSFDNAAPTDQILEGTFYAQVYAGADVLIFCGPASTDAAVKQSRAHALPALTLYAFECAAGEALHIWADLA